MPVIINEEKCIGCSLCVVECPEEAISARVHAFVDEKLCIDCLECIGCCPGDAISEEGSQEVKA